MGFDFASSNPFIQPLRGLFSAELALAHPEISTLSAGANVSMDPLFFSHKVFEMVETLFTVRGLRGPRTWAAVEDTAGLEPSYLASRIVIRAHCFWLRCCRRGSRIGSLNGACDKQPLAPSLGIPRGSHNLSKRRSLRGLGSLSCKTVKQAKWATCGAKSNH